jgi:ABC-type iron transport system FetAB ATPase subunit
MRLDIQINNLGLIGQAPLLRDIRLSVEAGSVHTLMGPSGSGKSIAFQLALAEKDRPCIYINGRRAKEAWPALRQAFGLSAASGRDVAARVLEGDVQPDRLDLGRIDRALRAGDLPIPRRPKLSERHR